MGAGLGLFEFMRNAHTAAVGYVYALHVKVDATRDATFGTRANIRCFLSRTKTALSSCEAEEGKRAHLFISVLNEKALNWILLRWHYEVRASVGSTTPGRTSTFSGEHYQVRASV
ncbi:unnamed protein product, partial [Ectocarpus sp. 12 AP-2014]